MEEEKKNTIEDAIVLLREYAENRWFTGENKVNELHNKQREELDEDWSMEMNRGEQNDTDSELYFKIQGQEKERDMLFKTYSKKYHEIHDVIDALKSLNNHEH